MQLGPEARSRKDPVRRQRKLDGAGWPRPRILPPMAGGGGRSTLRLLADACGVYRRYPLLFLVLAAAVIVPYELIVLAVLGGDGAARSGGDETIAFALALVDFLVITSLVSALHVHAVADLRAATEPRFRSIARRGLAALPVVCAATIMASLGIFLGFLALIVPGVIFWVRWAVVAQAAAIERQGWNAALSRSWAMSEGNWLHIFGFLITVAVIAGAPWLLLSLPFDDLNVASFTARLVLRVILVSFTALATALLYYDLRARRELLAATATAAEGAAPATQSAPVDRGYDPQAWSDAERPSGWYIDPERPKRMRYWGGKDSPGWRGETRAPRKLRARWEEER